jgi:hypothetical protein
VGAATHDVAIQLQMKRLRIVHRIDPQVDAERDFIAGNLAETRLVAHKGYLRCVDPVFKGETATGGSYYSDSRLLLLELHQEISGYSSLQRDAPSLQGGTGGGTALINATR